MKSNFSELPARIWQSRFGFRCEQPISPKAYSTLSTARVAVPEPLLPHHPALSPPEPLRIVLLPQSGGACSAIDPSFSFSYASTMAISSSLYQLKQALALKEQIAAHECSDCQSSP